MAKHDALDAILRKAGLPAQSGLLEGPAGGEANSPLAGEQDRPVPAVQAAQPSAPVAPTSAAAGPGASSVPDLPPLANAEEVIELFNRQHGRSPSIPETRAIQLVPILTAQLGRRPLRTELLAALDSRNETPANPQAQFREVAQEAQGGPGTAV